MWVVSRVQTVRNTVLYTVWGRQTFTLMEVNFHRGGSRNKLSNSLCSTMKKKKPQAHEIDWDPVSFMSSPEKNVLADEHVQTTLKVLQDVLELLSKGDLERAVWIAADAQSYTRAGGSRDSRDSLKVDPNLDF